MAVHEVANYQHCREYSGSDHQICKYQTIGICNKGGILSRLVDASWDPCAVCSQDNPDPHNCSDKIVGTFFKKYLDDNIIRVKSKI